MLASSASDRSTSDFDVLGAVVDEARGAGRVGRVAAALLLGRRFEHDDARARVARRDGGRCRRIAGTDNDDVGVQSLSSHFLRVPRVSQHVSRERLCAL